MGVVGGVEAVSVMVGSFRSEPTILPGAGMLQACARHPMAFRSSVAERETLPLCAL